MSDEAEAAAGETGVVTVFVRHGSDVLLLRQSDAVGSYTGQWGSVAGHAEDDPGGMARQEVREETGIDPDTLSLVRRGDPFPVEDPEHGVWRVHPFLFDCPTREVTTNRETTEYEWVQPPAILDRETVPRLWESYWRVAPTVAGVREDRDHGSEYVSRRAVEVLRDAAASLDAGVGASAALPGGTGDDAGDTGDDPDTVDAADDWSRLAALAEELLAARESMAVVANRVNQVMAEATGDATDRDATAAGGADRNAATDRTAGAVRRAAERLLAGLDDARIEPPDALRGATVATLSRSGTVRNLLSQCDPTEVVVAESRPGGEGRAVATALAETLAADVTLCGDAGVAHALDARDADAVLVGADTVLADGSVVNKVGTRTLASAAAVQDVPVLVAAHTDKMAPPGRDPDLEPRDPDELLPVDDGDPPAALRVEHPTFDVTPPSLVERYLTEGGSLTPDDMREAPPRAAARTDWARH